MKIKKPFGKQNKEDANLIDFTASGSASSDAAASAGGAQSAAGSTGAASSAAQVSPAAGTQMAAGAQGGSSDVTNTGRKRRGVSGLIRLSGGPSPGKPERRGRMGRKSGRGGKGPQAGAAAGEISAAEAASIGAAAFMDNDGFEARVRSSEPILRLDEAVRSGGWKNELVLNLSCAALVMAFISLFLMAAQSAGLILFAIPAFVVFMGITTLESLMPGKVRWITTAVIAVILIAAVIIWHKRIGAGAAYVVNQFYDIAEEAQAYLYRRFSIGDSASYNDCRIATAWASCSIALIAALPPFRARRCIAVVLSLIAMFAFAYYGLVPSAICVGVLLAAVILSVSRSNVLSLVPVLLAAALVFGAVMLIDPGEFYGISRADENLRDRIALKSALIESSFSEYYDDMSSITDPQDQSWDETQSEDTALTTESRKYIIIGVIALLIAAIGAACFILWRRYRKKQLANRAGLDSSGAREAVTAMFPYSVKWLKSYGVDAKAVPFPAMESVLGADFSEDYAKRFRSMYELWSEAAYSDHEISEENRRDMDGFMQDTIRMIDEKCSLREKLRLKYICAL